MAAKDFALRATPAAAAVIERLRGTARKNYAAFKAELRKQGCRVAGYRLLGPEDGGYSDFCCRRLVDDWRAITTPACCGKGGWPSVGTVPGGRRG